MTNVGFELQIAGTVSSEFGTIIPLVIPVVRHRSWPPLGVSHMLQSVSMRTPIITVNGATTDQTFYWTSKVDNIPSIEDARRQRTILADHLKIPMNEIRILRITAELIE